MKIEVKQNRYDEKIKAMEITQNKMKGKVKINKRRKKTEEIKNTKKNYSEKEIFLFNAQKNASNLFAKYL